MIAPRLLRPNLLFSRVGATSANFGTNLSVGTNWTIDKLLLVGINKYLKEHWF